jgi:HAD superfamily hydrolase (TIGR01484 family)
VTPPDFRGLPPISERRMVLATDLDGTFLGGEKAARRSLYNWIEDNRRTVGLVFVTGRDPDFIVDLCQGEVPWPEYVVGDVGTSITQVTSDGQLEPILELEEAISARWGGSGITVRARLDGHPGLTLQRTQFRYRVSYDLDPDAFDPAAHSLVEELGLDTLVSDNRYFDVLPRGVSKGPSVRRFAEHFGIDEARVLVAGDTMNDVSMLELGLPAVAVGGSEAALIERVAPHDHVHKASATGAAGIAEAIAAFDLHPLPEEVRNVV